MGKQKNKISKKCIAKKVKNQLSSKQKRYILSLTWVLIFLPLLILGVMLVSTPEDELPSTKQLENPKSDEASLVYSFDGKILGSYYVSNRTKINYAELSPYLIQALVSTEDERYFDHSGIDGWALGRAVSGAAIGNNKGGGSTITQQLAKMMFHERPKSRYTRIRQKLAEWIIATRIETRYTKEEIIAMYFNEFDFLNTAVGIHSAARVYFDKAPIDLKIEEAAMLVGMAKNPSIYNPVKHPEKTLQRREVVLSQMKKNKVISKNEYDSLRTLPLGLQFNPETHTSGLAPYFREWIKQQTLDIIKSNNLKNQFDAPINIYIDGLKIYTTLDAKMQQHAEWAVQEHLGSELQFAFDKDIQNNKNYPFGKEVNKISAESYLQKEMKKSDRYKQLKVQGWTDEKIRKHFNETTTLQLFDWNAPKHSLTVEMSPMDSIKHTLKTLRSGLISIDPRTGFVKAWVGGPDYRHFKFDYAGQGQRQVGSTMKPFVYAAALESKVATPCKEYPNIKYCIDLDNGKQWCPSGEKNYDEVMTPVYFGLASSMNNITAKLIAEAGGKNARVVQYFMTMGLQNPSITPVPSLGLGVCDLSVLDMTAAHCVFSNNGNYIEPITILRIEDASGKILYEAKNAIIPVINETIAFDVLKMMKGVTGVKTSDGRNGGTARRLRWNRPYQFKHILAGKTGTTQSNADGWFIGHTPDLVTGIWVGCETRSIHFNSTALGQGANSALPIWGYYMQRVYNDKKIKISHGDIRPPIQGMPTSIECIPDTNDVLPSIFDGDFY